MADVKNTTTVGEIKDALRQAETDLFVIIRRLEALGVSVEDIQLKHSHTVGRRSMDVIEILFGVRIL